jgi:hypothetical protein
VLNGKFGASKSPTFHILNVNPIPPPKAYPYISSSLISSIWPKGQYLFQKVKSDEQTKGVEIGFATHKYGLQHTALHYFTGRELAVTYFISTPLVGAPMRDRDSLAKDL